MSKRLAFVGAVALATLLATVALSVLTVLPAGAATPANGGVYTLAVAASGKCLEVAGGSADNGALLQQNSCSAGSTRQQWRVVSSSAGGFNLVNVGSTRCADVPSSSSSSGIQLQQWGCGDGTKVNQRWSFSASGAAAGKYTIASAASGLCVSDRDGSTAGNNPIIQENCSDISRMQWLFNQVGGNPNPGPGVPYSNVPDGFAQGVTGGAGGQTVTVTNQSQLNQYVTSSSPYVIRVASTINISPKGTELRVASNMTIIGVGTAGHIVGGGFFLGATTRTTTMRSRWTPPTGSGSTTTGSRG